MWIFNNTPITCTKQMVVYLPWASDVGLLITSRLCKFDISVDTVVNRSPRMSVLRRVTSVYQDVNLLFRYIALVIWIHIRRIKIAFA